MVYILKKIFLLLLVLFIALTPFSSAFAMDGGFLNGKTLYRGSGLFNYFDSTYKATNNIITDGTTLNTSSNKYLWYTFPSLVDIDSYLVKANGTAGISFYDENGVLIQTLDDIFTNIGNNTLGDVTVLVLTQ